MGSWKVLDFFVSKRVGTLKVMKHWFLIFVQNLTNINVEEILCRFAKGSDIVEHLKAGEFYSARERCFLVKTLARYLMSNCRV